MDATLKRNFMARWKQMKESADSHPYAKWVTVTDMRTADACKALSGRVWNVKGVALAAVIREHIAGKHTNCRCRLSPMSESALQREGLALED